ncbi:hypothetical protein J6590_015660 [Homalodisca vitripennis]|nr:hypothetical protein J6590_015660 [Homalodisca vitripennis]
MLKTPHGLTLTQWGPVRWGEGRKSFSNVPFSSANSLSAEKTFPRALGLTVVITFNNPPISPLFPTQHQLLVFKLPGKKTSSKRPNIVDIRKGARLHRKKIRDNAHRGSDWQTDNILPTYLHNNYNNTLSNPHHRAEEDEMFHAILLNIIAKLGRAKTIALQTEVKRDFDNCLSSFVFSSRIAGIFSLRYPSLADLTFSYCLQYQSKGSKTLYETDDQFLNSLGTCQWSLYSDCINTFWYNVTGCRQTLYETDDQFLNSLGTCQWSLYSDCINTFWYNVTGCRQTLYETDDQFLNSLGTCQWSLYSDCINTFWYNVTGCRQTLYETDDQFLNSLGTCQWSLYSDCINTFWYNVTGCRQTLYETDDQFLNSLGTCQWSLYSDCINTFWYNVTGCRQTLYETDDQFLNSLGTCQWSYSIVLIHSGIMLRVADRPSMKQMISS